MAEKEGCLRRRWQDGWEESDKVTNGEDDKKMAGGRGDKKVDGGKVTDIVEMLTR